VIWRRVFRKWNITPQVVRSVGCFGGECWHLSDFTCRLTSSFLVVVVVVTSCQASHLSNLVVINPCITLRQMMMSKRPYMYAANHLKLVFTSDRALLLDLYDPEPFITKMMGHYHKPVS
jgi:hypothetical protein